MSIDSISSLAKVLAREDTVLFIGSGISLWSGLPTWGRMIEELAAFLEEHGVTGDLVRSEAKRGDLLQAASYGFDKLTKQQIGEFIRKSCRFGTAQPHRIHEVIVNLGPTCYITTNYDNLIEESLRTWQNGKFFRPSITNRHLTETAEVVHARAVDFVYKPHGDAGDSDSIILTREQYRSLLPGGERMAALESVKMLLASRPVVYLGFGLRDPDFIYLRDLLANTYKGGIRDHYAVMADVSEDEIDYWRRNYGIHLLGYRTIQRSDGSLDHSTLLDLLSNIAPSEAQDQPSGIVQEDDAEWSPEHILALARHASVLSRYPKEDPEFLVRVQPSSELSWRPGNIRRAGTYERFAAQDFIQAGPKRAALIGLPGAGKSYSLRRAAATLADGLHDACLGEKAIDPSTPLPLLVDLKQYHGDLFALISSTLPTGLTLDYLANRLDVKVLIDSFNEMPREVWESGSYEADFAKFIARFPQATIVVGSRTSDGLLKLGLDIYSLDLIDETVVKKELKKRNTSVSGPFERELLLALRRPFFFFLFLNGNIELGSVRHPRDLYHLYFEKQSSEFKTRFGIEVDLERILSSVAYEAINEGQEALLLSTTIQLIKDKLEANHIAEVSPTDLANWLVSRQIFIPYRGNRITVFHQSATEYLAAKELAELYQRNPTLLKEKLRLKRWDQALFLTLSFLDHETSQDFINTVLEFDFLLAMRAVKYLEFNQEEVVSVLLTHIVARFSEFGALRHQIQWLIQSELPISDAHIPLLRSMLKEQDSIAAAAILRLAILIGADMKPELMQLLVKNRHHYNFCAHGIGPALAALCTEQDIGFLVTLLDLGGEVDTKLDEEDRDIGLIVGLASVLSRFELTAVWKHFVGESSPSTMKPLKIKVLCDTLQVSESGVALRYAADLIADGVKEAAFPLCLIATYGRNIAASDWATLNTVHIKTLLAWILDARSESEYLSRWSLAAIKGVCRERSDLVPEVIACVSGWRDFEKFVVIASIDPDGKSVGFEALERVTEMSAEDINALPLIILEELDLDWHGHEELLSQLLLLRRARLALYLVDRSGGDKPLPRLGAIDLSWWLAWMQEEAISEKGWLFCDRIGRFLAESTAADTRMAALEEFNNPQSKYRHLLENYILPRFEDLSTDEFNESSISFLLANLYNRGDEFSPGGSLLGDTGTEMFVYERLLPLLASADGIFLANLKNAIIAAGSRHGKRYVSI